MSYWSICRRHNLVEPTTTLVDHTGDSRAIPRGLRFHNFTTRGDEVGLSRIYPVTIHNQSRCHPHPNRVQN